MTANEAIAGRVCAVTGASSGLGRAIARSLAAEGGRVVGLARRFEHTSLPALPDRGEVAQLRLDVTRESDVRARFESIGPVDVLVVSAGVAGFGPAADLTADDLREMLEVHVVGAFLCAREAMRSMVSRRSGHIVSIGSVATSQSFPDSAGYTAAKSGQRGLMRILADEAREHDVKLTQIAPGATDTPLWDGRPAFDRARMMKPDEVAGLVVDAIRRPGVAAQELTVIPPGGNL